MRVSSYQQLPQPLQGAPDTRVAGVSQPLVDAPAARDAKRVVEGDAVYEAKRKKKRLNDFVQSKKNAPPWILELWNANYSKLKQGTPERDSFIDQLNATSKTGAGTWDIMQRFRILTFVD